MQSDQYEANCGNCGYHEHIGLDTWISPEGSDSASTNEKSANENVIEGEERKGLASEYHKYVCASCGRVVVRSKRINRSSINLIRLVIYAIFAGVGGATVGVFMLSIVIFVGLIILAEICFAVYAVIVGNHVEPSQCVYCGSQQMFPLVSVQGMKFKCDRCGQSALMYSSKDI